MSDIPFERTVCACEEDVENCYLRPGYLGVGDAARIAAVHPAPLFRRGEAILGSAATGRRLRIPTVVPARRNGRCVFLDASDRCTVHAVAPYGCAYFDVHMPQAECDRRSLWMLRRIAADADYQRHARSLEPKGADKE